MAPDTEEGSPQASPPGAVRMDAGGRNRGRGEAGLPGPWQASIGQEPYNSALASAVKWLEHRPVHQKVTGLISGQGQVLGF